MSYAVVFSPEAEEPLAELYRHIAAAVSPDLAVRDTEAIVTYCVGRSISSNHPDQKAFVLEIGGYAYLVRLKAQAMREGIPYQTWIRSILHKSVAS